MKEVGDIEEELRARRQYAKASGGSEAYESSDDEEGGPRRAARAVRAAVVSARLGSKERVQSQRTQLPPSGEPKFRGARNDSWFPAGAQGEGVEEV